MPWMWPRDERDIKERNTFKQTTQTVRVAEIFGAKTDGASLKIVSKGWISLLATRHLPFYKSNKSRLHNMLKSYPWDIADIEGGALASVVLTHFISRTVLSQFWFPTQSCCCCTQDCIRECSHKQTIRCLSPLLCIGAFFWDGMESVLLQ